MENCARSATLPESASQVEVNGHHLVGRSRQMLCCGDHVRSTLPDLSAL